MDEYKDGAIDFVELISKIIVEKFKKSPELQEYLNSYGMGLF